MGNETKNANESGSGQEFAGFGVRFAARLVDWIAAWVLPAPKNVTKKSNIY